MVELSNVGVRPKQGNQLHPPVISLTSHSVIQEIDDACSTWGAFVLTDHGIPSEALDHILDLGHEFFNLPLGTKNEYKLQNYGAKWRGFMPIGGERSIKGKIRDLKEGLYMGDEHPADHPLNGMPTFGTNIFPDEEIPDMKSSFLQYHNQMRDLGNRMMRILALGLGLGEGHIEENVTEHDPVILPRMFRYEKCASASPPEASGGDKEHTQEEEHIGWGICRHSDYGLWTMILTDSQGLEFQHPMNETWHKVPFVKHGIIMNVGDVLDRLSSGRYISAYHRARNPSTSSYRLSLPFFYDPSWTARMQQLPIDNIEKYETPARADRWSETNISCKFDGKVEYSQFLAKKVAKVFPELVPEKEWKNLKSTSQPSTRHALVVPCPDISIISKAVEKVKDFYVEHTEIKASHGWTHINAVFEHTKKAMLSLDYGISSKDAMEIKLAALCHDMDDNKYFPDTCPGEYPNASAILEAVGITHDDDSGSRERIVKMISWVGCSENGNSVPEEVEDAQTYHFLIPRWADRLEAVGARGVVRCYQYNQEKGQPLSSEASPRPQSEEELWAKYAVPSKLQEYMDRGGTSTDMISHYYDKLLHISHPPAVIVRNPYLEGQAKSSSVDLVEVCLRYGKTGEVDTYFIMNMID